MKKISKTLKTLLIALCLAFGINLFTIPVMANSKEDTASVTRVSQVTYLSGELTGQQSRSKSFSISGPAGVKVVYSSSAQSGSQAAPVTVYIDGIKVGRTNGLGSVYTTIWNLSAGSHTLKVTNGGVWSSFAVDIVTLV